MENDVKKSHVVKILYYHKKSLFLLFAGSFQTLAHSPALAIVWSQPAFTCFKATMEIPEQCVNSAQS